jgi:hypothetical protein
MPDQAQILIVSSNSMLLPGVEELLPCIVESMFKQSAGDDKDIVKYDLLILTMLLMELG